MNVHPTAEVSEEAIVGSKTKIWHHTQVREYAIIGENCTIGKGVYVGKKVVIGNKVKIQNYACVYEGSIVEDFVFIGPHVCLTNDKLPRTTTIQGELQTETNWNQGRITIKKGASLGAGSIVLPNVVVGKYAMVGAGSLVTKSVPNNAMVFGSPAQIQGYVCNCGAILTRDNKKPMSFLCSNCTKNQGKKSL